MGRIFSKDEITTFICATYDAYIKKTCKNILIDFKRSEGRDSSHDISIVSLSNEENNGAYDEPCFSKVEDTQVDACGYKVSISDETLASAINNLPDKNKATLVLHIVLNIPLKEIASMLGVSERMVRKYKRGAIDQIRKDMPYEKQD